MTALFSFKDRMVLKSSLSELVKARMLISKVGIKAEVEPIQLSQFEMAVDESLANIIENNYKNDDQSDITLFCYFEDHYLIAEIESDGKGYYPELSDNFDLHNHFASKKTRGLGIYIINQLIDIIEITAVPEDKHRLILKKEIQEV